MLSQRRRYVCTFNGCAKTFPSPSHLLIHSRTHTREKPYICNFTDCNTAFASSGDLNKHIQIHSGVCPFKCDYVGCRAAFVQAGNLQQHTRSHTQERPYLCKFAGCSSAFKQLGHLQTHIRTHSNERPFKCEFTDCNLAFTRSGHLKVHRRVHTGEKPYKCDFANCELAFAESGALKKHRRTHTLEKPYKCNFVSCDSAFAQAGDRKSHIFYHHTREGNVRMKKDEGRILSLLRKHNIPFKEQHHIDFRCIGDDRDGDRCFIDFIVEVQNESGKMVGYLFLEVDEKQHQHYETRCELRRMSDVHRSLTLEGNTLPIAFIRYNPDAYRIDNRLIRTLKRQREQKLIDTINSWTFERPFGIHYMYYDTIEGAPAVFLDAAYNESYKKLAKLVLP